VSSFAAWLHGVLAWLHGPVVFLRGMGQAMLANVWDVAANRPEPARQVLFATFGLVVVAWAAFKIIRRAGR
jgi:hypothetical protein